jgi:hypothetical protein
MCGPCQTIVDVSHCGKHQLDLHLQKTKCKKNRSLMSTLKPIEQNTLMQPLLRNIQRAEIIFAATIAKQDLAMSKAPKLVLSNKHMYIDSQIAKDMSESRTKATCIIKNVMSPVFLNNLVKELKMNKFGLLVDETTTIDTKSVICLRVRFFDVTVQSCFLALIQYEDGTAEGLFNTIKSFLDKHGIPLTNISSFCSDGANVVSGANNSVMSRLKEINPHLLVMKCLSHTANLIASHACDELPEVLTRFMNGICNYFSNSSKRRRKFESLQESFNVPLHKLISKSKTRWLSTEHCVNRILEQWEPLKAFFLIEYGDTNEELNFLLDHLKSRTTYSYLLFLKQALAQINRFNLIFQSSGCQIQNMVKESQNLFLFFASQVVKTSYLKANQHNLSNINFNNEDCLLGPNHIDIPSEVSSYMNLNNMDPANVMSLKSNCRKFIIRVCKELLDRLPIFDQNGVLSVLDLHVAMSDYSNIVPVMYRFPNVIDKSPADQLAIEWRMMKLNNDFDASDDTLAFWSSVINYKGATGTPAYPNICKLIKHLLTLPFGTAEVERDFSLLSIIKNKLRNCLKIETVDALLRVRENVPYDMNLFEPCEMMFTNFNSAMYRKKKDDSEVNSSNRN